MEFGESTNFFFVVAAVVVNIDIEPDNLFQARYAVLKTLT
jgi:hypothetical protein